jgi:hypothetical protein
MDDKDIDKLLSEDGKQENDVESGESAEQGSSPEKKDGAEGKPSDDSEKLRKENERLKRALAKRNEEFKRIESEKAKPEEVEPDPDDELATREGWLKKIDEVASSKVKPILEANRNKAVKEFIQKHPEYSSPEMRDKLKECVSSADGLAEQGEIMDAMCRTWAGQNYAELEKALADRSRSKSNSQKLASKSLGTGEGIRKDNDFTDDEVEKAAKMGISVEAYRKAVSDYEMNSVGLI